MATQIQCRFGPDLIDVGLAIQLRDHARAAKQPRPDFRCPECNERTRPHAGGIKNAAHFEHVERNVDCLLCHSGYVQVAERPNATIPKPDYSIDDPKAIEGYQLDRHLTVQARNQGIVKACKERDDFQCQACDFRLKIGDRYVIECHHTKPIAEYGEREVSLSELVCLCPTCHRIAHTRKQPFALFEIKQLLNQQNAPETA